jgi:hypothetical protein
MFFFSFSCSTYRKWGPVFTAKVLDRYPRAGLVEDGLVQVQPDAREAHQAAIIQLYKRSGASEQSVFFNLNEALPAKEETGGHFP